MKSIFLVSTLLFCQITFCQTNQNKECKLWLGDPYDSISLIKAMAEKYMQFELKMVANDENIKTMYELKDNDELCQIKIWMKSKKVLTGTTLITFYLINSVKIVSLSERIDNLFSALKEKVADCISVSTKTNAVFSSGKMFIENQGGDWSKKNLPMSTLTITPNQ